jgi:ATP-dependent DNA helicase PIF1
MNSNKIEINRDFKNAFQSINSGENVFVSGSAGSGKSTLLRLVVKRSGSNSIVLAPTGVAALNVGGQTIHSFFRFPARLIQREDIWRPRNAELFRSIETIILDEVSMIRADLWSGMDCSLRLHRGDPRPFGGVQVVAFGDFGQLPTVVDSSNLEDYLDRHFGGPFVFNVEAFRQLHLKAIRLKKIYRQHDSKFIEILDSLRKGTLTKNQLRELNSCVSAEPQFRDRDQVVQLTTTKLAARNINEGFLRKLAGEAYLYEATVCGNFYECDYPGEARLKLKPKAKVMMLANDSRRRFVNGSLGQVVEVGPDFVSVSIDGCYYEIEPFTWEKFEYEYDRQTGQIYPEVTGTFEQYPIRLGWALTIHKAQGLSFDKVHLDLGSGAFTHGQCYVGLSRCRSLEGLTLGRSIRRQDIIVDSRIRDYMMAVESMTA